MNDRGAGFAKIRLGTLYAKWARDNPGERAKLDAYFYGGPVPTAATRTGKAFSLFAQALDGFDELIQGSLFKAWDEDNPGESSKLALYRIDEGPYATVTSATGRALLLWARMLKPQDPLWRKDIAWSTGLSAFSGNKRTAAWGEGFRVVLPNLLHDVSAPASEAELKQISPTLRGAGWLIGGWGTYGQGTNPVIDAQQAFAKCEQHDLDGWCANGEAWAEYEEAWKTQAFLEEWLRLAGGDIPLSISCLASDTDLQVRAFDYDSILNVPAVSVQPQVYGNVDAGGTVAATLGSFARAGVPRSRMNLTFGTYSPPGPIPWPDYATWAGARGVYLAERIPVADWPKLRRN